MLSRSFLILFALAILAAFALPAACLFAAAPPAPARVSVTTDSWEVVKDNGFFGFDEDELVAGGAWSLPTGATPVEIQVALILTAVNGDRTSELVIIPPSAMAGGVWNLSAAEYFFNRSDVPPYTISVQNVSLVYHGSAGLLKNVTAW